MLVHPDLMLTIVNDRTRELVAESDRRRLLAGARDARRARRAKKAPAVRGRPAATVPAR